MQDRTTPDARTGAARYPRYYAARGPSGWEVLDRGRFSDADYVVETGLRMRAVAQAVVDAMNAQAREAALS